MSRLTMTHFYKSIGGLLMFLYCISASAQSITDSAKINFIKAKFLEINQLLATYKKIIKEDTEQTTEGNQVTAYYDKNGIKKILAVYYGETGKRTIEYYFFDKKLIFYYDRDENYDVPISAAKPPGNVKIASAKEIRYYFNDNKIIKHINKPDKKLTDKEVSDTGSDVQRETKRLLYLISPGR